MTSSLPTRLAHAGRTSTVPGGQPVNPPVVRASTVLFDSVAQQREMRARRDTERLFTYGARGNPTNFALEDMVFQGTVLGPFRDCAGTGPGLSWDRSVTVPGLVRGCPGTVP